MEPPKGLCTDCAHAREVRSARGSVYLLCRRHEHDPSYPKYPELPVRTCPGHAPRDQGAG